MLRHECNEEVFVKGYFPSVLMNKLASETFLLFLSTFLAFYVIKKVVFSCIL